MTHLSDQQIWASIQALMHETGCTEPSLIIDAIAEREGIDRDQVKRIYRERIVMGGAG
jgi:hypothetical protein